jgi:hypothetical protein
MMPGHAPFATVISMLQRVEPTKCGSFTNGKEDALACRESSLKKERE